MACISDTHGLHQKLDLEEGDVLIHGGDFTMRGYPNEVPDFAKWFGKQPFKHKILVPGNHDLCLDDETFARLIEPQNLNDVEKQKLREQWDSKNLKKMITDAGENIHILEHEAIELNGVKFFGSPYIPPVGDWGYMLEAEDREKKWAEIPEDTHVLINHTPARNILDGFEYLPDNDQRRFGCPSLVSCIKRVKPLLHVVGHVHEGYGSTVMEHDDGKETIIVNASSCTLQYKIHNEVIRLNVSQDKVEITEIGESCSFDPHKMNAVQ